jgi:hypothetical protein
MTIRIIDNQKINLTDDEYKYYYDMCRRYDRQSYKGEDIFKGLFITNEDGLIVFIHPPKEKAASMEVYMFVISIMHMQAVRVLYQKYDLLCKKLEDRINKALDKLE